MEERQVVSVVMTSTPLRKSMGSPATPGPANSSTQLFTKPLPKVAFIRAMAASWGPTPRFGVPVR